MDTPSKRTTAPGAVVNWSRGASDELPGHKGEIGNLDRKVCSGVRSTVMILTCPECATGYFVDDGLVKASGRTVRCAGCAHRWTAYPPAADKPLDLVTSEERDRQAGRGRGTGSAHRRRPAPPVPRPRREERRNRRATLNGGCAGRRAAGGAGAAGTRGGVPRAVVKVWPPTASLFAAIDTPVNAAGVVVEQARAETALRDSHPAWVISGAVRITDHPVTAPPLRILRPAQRRRQARRRTDP